MSWLADNWLYLLGLALVPLTGIPLGWLTWRLFFRFYIVPDIKAFYEDRCPNYGDGRETCPKCGSWLSGGPRDGQNDREAYCSPCGWNYKEGAEADKPCGVSGVSEVHMKGVRECCQKTY